MRKGRFFFNHAVLNIRKHKKQRIQLLTDIIDSGAYLNGEQNKKLTKKIERFLGNPYITTVASGHDALLLSLLSLHLLPTDEILFPVNAYPTAFPLALSGAKMVPIDVDNNGQLNIDEVNKKITKNTKVIVTVHMYGLVNELSSVLSIAKKNNIILIEDCAQSFGSFYKNQAVGTFGDISCFSFYPTKNLATLGDGGAIWTKHINIHNFLEKARSYGEISRYDSEFVSGHSRLPEIQAGILNLYFKSIKRDFRNRQKVAKYYIEQLEDDSLKPYVRVLKSSPNSKPVPHLFVAEVKNRENLMSFLLKKKIETYVHYPYPIHLVKAFSYLNYKEGDFPVSERLSKNILSFPFHQSLSLKAINYIAEQLKMFYLKHNKN